MTAVWIFAYIGVGACVSAFLTLIDKLEGKDG